MKRLTLLIAIIGLSASVLTSCKNDTSKKPEKPNKEHKGPKGEKHPDGKKDRKKGIQYKTIEEIGGYQIGETATDFSLKNVDGTMVSLASIENAKGYIVAFTCNECPYSKLYEDRLEALNKKYAPKGYPVIAINSNNPEKNEKESIEAMKARAAAKGFTFPYLVDSEGIYKKYGAVRTPHIFLLDSNKAVQYIGSIDDNSKFPEDVTRKYVEEAIEALEKGEKPNPNLTKAIGCPVKA